MSDKVGYGNPPAQRRWKKGQSGNPSGRPKKQPTLSDDLRDELKEIIQIVEGGKTKRITKQRAVVKALTAGGIKGNGRAASLLLGLCARLIEQDPNPQAQAEMSEADRKIVEAYLQRQVELRLAQKKDESQ